MAEIPWMNEDGSFVEGFAAEALPEEMRDYAKDAKTFADLVKRGVDTQHEFSSRAPLPKTPEEMPQFFRKHLAGAEKPEDYEIGKPADWPEGVKFNDRLVTSFLTAAAEAGAPKAMIQAIAARTIEADKATHLADVEAIATKQQELADKSAEAIKEAWKDDYDTNLELARRGFVSEHVPDILKKTIAQQLGVETLTDEHVLKALQGNASLAMICRSFGALTADDTSISGTPGGKAPDEVVPYHKTRPHLYASRPDDDPEKQWYVAHGYDFTLKQWTKGAPAE